MGLYDDTIKSLVGKNPQALISFVLDGAVYQGDVEPELKARIHKNLQESQMYQEIWQEATRIGKAEDIVFFVEARFPTLLTQVGEVFANRTTLEQLQAILRKLYRANTLEEATAALQEHANS
jgi:hypothetical protein